ncbi:NADH-ubiquinone oxidoreductase chain 2 [Bienertia sinuspersici]
MQKGKKKPNKHWRPKGTYSTTEENGVRTNPQTTKIVPQRNRAESVEEGGQQQNSHNHQKEERNDNYTAQTIHCAVFPKSGANPFNCTFIYAFSTAVERQSLWKCLKECAKKYPGPWLTMGDINCVINMEEILGSLVRLGEMQEARECFEECDSKDIPYTGFYYTWSNKQEAEGRVFSIAGWKPT